jgi:4-amino-4-deoxy-L-arabinose transferase-like glycosyltransferase
MGTIFRVVLAGSIGLGVDESYAAAMSRSLSLSYFDHPPLHFWLIWLTAHITGSENGLVLRLPFILLFAGSTWMMYRLGERLFSEWTGFYAALLFNISAVFSLSTGSWLLPDGPLMFFMLAATLVIVHLFFSPAIPKSVWWGGAGTLIGLGLLSKYHAIFIIAGSFVFLLTSKYHRNTLLTVYPYLTVAMAFVIFAPVIIWNQEHNWISFLFQGSRGLASGVYPVKMLGNVAGQAAWVLPWIWVPLIWSLLKALAAGPGDALRNPLQNHCWFLGLLAAGPILLFTVAAFWGAQGLFHWQAPGYLLAFPLLGREVVAQAARNSKAVRWWLRGSVSAFLIIVLVLGSHTNNGWLRQAAPQWFASGDPTIEALDWSNLDAYLRQKQRISGSASFIVAGHWIDAGKIDYIVGGRLPVLCLNREPHHFAFLHNNADFKGKDALLIGRRHMMHNADTMFHPYFSSIEPVGTVTITRAGVPEMDVVIFYARNFTGTYPLPYGR